MSEDGDRHNSSEVVDRQVERGNGGKPAFVASDATLTYARRTTTDFWSV